jgi:hypothetical protein
LPSDGLVVRALDPCDIDSGLVKPWTEDEEAQELTAPDP